VIAESPSPSSLKILYAMANSVVRMEMRYVTLLASWEEQQGPIFKNIPVVERFLLISSFRGVTHFTIVGKNIEK
jgi:hypothetical protein